MKEKNLIPKRRFKEFINDEAWEQRKLGEIAGRYDNLRIPVTASNRIPGATPYYGANGIQDYVDGFTHNGEFVLIAEDGANDLRNYPVHYVNGKVWVNNHAHVIQALEGKSDNRFLKYSFNTLNIEPYLVGGGRAKLNANIMMDLVINTPTIKEQKKIGRFFLNLDNLITLHQRKLKKLKETKSAYLSEMFPKEGEKYPKRRFDGFTDPWEQRKLEELAGRYDNLRIPVTASNRIPGSTPYYGANGIQDYVEGFTHNGEYVLIAEDGANDLNDYPVQYVNGKVWVNNHAHVIQAIEGISDNRFLKYSFKTLNIEPYLVGGSRAKLNANIMMNLIVNTPTIKEQEKIGAFFKELDNLITLHQRKLEKLQNLKKAYLNEMFV